MRMVTRTITSSVIVTKCIDTDTMEVIDKTFTFGKVGTDEKILTRIINKSLKNSNLKLVKIVGVTEDTVRYRMTEEKFIESADVIE